MGWLEFGIAMGLFLSSHRIPAVFGLKQRLIAALGPRGYTLVFSLFSTLLLFWVIWAAGRAPVVTLWEQTLVARWAVNLVMPVSVLLVVFGTAAPNPFAFEGRSTGFEADKPGIAGITRQPLLWALLFWSAAHIWANGELAHVLLFGIFTLFSILGMRLVERRRRRDLGETAWAQLTARTGLMPFAALLGGRWKPSRGPSAIRLALAVSIWVALWHLHAPVIGVYPGP